MPRLVSRGASGASKAETGAIHSPQHSTPVDMPISRRLTRAGPTLPINIPRGLPHPSRAVCGRVGSRPRARHPRVCSDQSTRSRGSQYPTFEKNEGWGSHLRGDAPRPQNLGLPPQGEVSTSHSQQKSVSACTERGKPPGGDQCRLQRQGYRRQTRRYRSSPSPHQSSKQNCGS